MQLPTTTPVLFRLLNPLPRYGAVPSAHSWNPLLKRGFAVLRTFFRDVVPVCRLPCSRAVVCRVDLGKEVKPGGELPESAVRIPRASSSKYEYRDELSEMRRSAG